MNSTKKKKSDTEEMLMGGKIQMRGKHTEGIYG